VEMPPSQTELASLAFVSYLYRLGAAQSELPLPMQAAALLMFHDAAELFLRLACERANVGRSGISFMGYFDRLEGKVGQELQHRESMRRLNDARVGLKHFGNLPAESTIETFRTTIREFLDDNCQLLFDVRFVDVSLVDCVTEPEAKEFLREAERLLSAGHSLSEAGWSIRKAFRLVLDGAEQSRTRSLIAERAPYWQPAGGWIRDQRERMVDEFGRRASASVRELQDVMRLMALGIDYRRYVEFRHHVPTESGVWMRTPTPTGIRYAIDFVIDTALHLQALPP